MKRRARASFLGRRVEVAQALVAVVACAPRSTSLAFMLGGGGAGRMHGAVMTSPQVMDTPPATDAWHGEGFDRGPRIPKERLFGMPLSRQANT